MIDQKHKELVFDYLNEYLWGSWSMIECRQYITLQIKLTKKLQETDL
jgi:hypothetical protein